MLTKSDLQSIQKLLHTQTEKSVRSIVHEEIETESQKTKVELQKTILGMETSFTKKLSTINSRLRTLDVKTIKIQKDVKKCVDFLDKENLKVVKRVQRTGLNLFWNNFQHRSRVGI